jgi:hypothetical protein
MTRRPVRIIVAWQVRSQRELALAGHEPRQGES